jgi:hypothetical protein
MIDLPIGKAIVAYPANRKCGYVCEIERARREQEDRHILKKKVTHSVCLNALFKMS